MTDTLSPSAPASRGTALRQWLLVPANQLFILLMVLVAFPLLFELGRTPVQLWDEARLAVSAVEMARSGSNWLITTFQGQPDHWSTKPPFLIWCQVLSFKLFGYTPWALRLPTALSALGTVVLLYRFAASHLHRPLAGFFGCLVLVTAAGYLRLHGARTGDYDTMLAFWEVVVWLSFFYYLEDGRPRHLYWLGGALVAAVLTKGVAGLLGVPALLLYAILRGKLVWLLRQPRLYAVAVGVVGVIAAYYLAREHYDPGYLKLVAENELGGRFSQTIEGHTGKWSFYFDTLYTKDFEGWLWWLLPAVLVWLQPDRLVRRAGSYLLLFVVGWLGVLSTSATKIDWYAIPAYPPLALLIGLGLDFLYHDVVAANLPRVAQVWAWPLRIGLIVGLFYFPYRAVMRHLVEERTSDYGMGPDAHLARYVGLLDRTQPDLNKLTLLHQNGYNGALVYYQTVLAEQKQKTIEIRETTNLRAIEPGTIVLACDPAYRVRLDSAYNLVTLHQDLPCESILLASRKQ